MTGQFPHWLTTQMINGVQGFSLDANVMALEGWRRGLTLKFFYTATGVTPIKEFGWDPVGKTFSLTNGDKTHFFFRSRGDKVANEAVDISSSKQLTKDYLERAGVSVPKGINFTSSHSEDDMLRESLKLGFPLVVKPTFGSLGKGVITNIHNEEALKEAIHFNRTELQYDDIIVEEYVKGDDMRIYVIDDQVVAATKRVPANVTGDGTSTIEELIQIKNELRKQNPHTVSRLIIVDQELKSFLNKQNLQLSSVPEKDQVVYLSGKSNISSGGDSIDVTDELTQKIKDFSVQAVRAIPGLVHAGIDVITDGENIHVIEINATAGVVLHLFPVYGKPRNVPQAIMDYYFPETKGLAEKSTKLYFDYCEIMKWFRAKALNQIELAHAPAGETYAKRYVISGKVQKVGFRRWIRKQALDRNLSGYTRNLANGNVVVVVGGNDQKVVNEFKEICRQGPERAQVENIKEFIWDTQIKIGFEIRKSN